MLTRKLFYILIVSILTTGQLFAQSQDPPTVDELERKIVKRELIDVAEGKWHYKVEYPELRLEGDLIHEGFKATAKQIAERQIRSFRKNMDAMTEEDWKTRPAKVDYEMSLGYEIELLNEDFVSVNFGQYEYTGGAHGNYWSITLNYDLKNNKILALNDLFKPNSNYLNIISKTSIEQISNKQGNYADVDWINKGAGLKEENFKSWNITAEGLKFTFDPYQVGPYSAGSFQTVIPYSQFLDRMKSSLFYRAKMASYIDGNPSNWCRNGLFTDQKVDFKLAYIKGGNNEKVHFRGDDKEDCPNGMNCQQNSYLVPQDEVIIGRIYNNYACAWYQPEKGNETVGWLPLNKLTVQGKKSPKYDWAGEWNFYDNDIKFIPNSNNIDYTVSGTAIWKGLGDNVHVGEIEANVKPKNGYFSVTPESKYDCGFQMQRVGKYLLVSDNNNCGGVNVSFDGVYLQKNNSQTADMSEVCSHYDFSEMNYNNATTDIDFRLGFITTRKGQRAYFLDENGKNKKSYLVQGDQVVVSRINGKNACAWYQPKEGKETVGWISLDNLAFQPSSAIRQSWIGSWEFGEGEIKVIPQKRSGAYKFKGQTFWVGKGEGNVNIGDIEFVGEPKADRLTSNGTKDLPRCMVKMSLLGNFLIVSDNSQCGGKNVTFFGVYRKK